MESKGWFAFVNGWLAGRPTAETAFKMSGVNVVFSLMYSDARRRLIRTNVEVCALAKRLTVNQKCISTPVVGPRWEHKVK